MRLFTIGDSAGLSSDMNGLLVARRVISVSLTQRIEHEKDRGGGGRGRAGQERAGRCARSEGLARTRSRRTASAPCARLGFESRCRRLSRPISRLWDPLLQNNVLFARTIAVPSNEHCGLTSRSISPNRLRREAAAGGKTRRGRVPVLGGRYGYSRGACPL